MEIFSTFCLGIGIVFGLFILSSLLHLLYKAFSSHLRTKKDVSNQHLVRHAILNADHKLRWSASRLALALRRNEITSIEIVQLCIEQIRHINPFINAVVGTRFERALEEAVEADKLFDKARKNNLIDALPPLLGVPMIAKEVHEYPMLPYTCGVYERRNRVGKKVNPVLARCEAAGAIVLCSANICEGCMWSESDNCVYGRTNNPYDCKNTYIILFHLFYPNMFIHRIASITYSRRQ